MRPHGSLSDRRFSTRPKSRRGLSFGEFVGCLIAVSGGVMLGSMYLGIDVKTMAIGILEKAELIEPGQFGTDEEATPTNAPAEDAGTAEEASAGDRASEDMESIPTIEITEPDNNEDQTNENRSELSSDSGATDSNGEFVVQLTEEQRASFTRLYWEKLVDAMQQESTNRLSAIAENPSWQLFDYLKHRQKGHQQAADAILSLDKQGIDAKVLDYSQKALQWHESGVKLHKRAVQLLTDAPSSELSGPFAQS